MAHEAQLEWERRWGRPAAAAAFASAALLVAGTVVRQAVALESRPDPDLEREFLAAVDAEASAFVVSSVLQSLNYLALGVVLWFLFQATAHRRQELPRWAMPLVYLGPVLLAAGTVIADLDRVAVAGDFMSPGEPTTGGAGEKRAEDLVDDPSVVAVTMTSAGTLALAFALVLVSLNAMRAGLLSRFLGIIGMIVGALYVLPLFGGPLIVQIFWLGAVGAVFLGYWPGGRGPAWESGQAEPWPSAAELRSRGARRAGGGGLEEEDEAGSATQPRTKKRKRRRRR